MPGLRSQRRTAVRRLLDPHADRSAAIAGRALEEPAGEQPPSPPRVGDRRSASGDWLVQDPEPRMAAARARITAAAGVSASRSGARPPSRRMSSSTKSSRRRPSSAEVTDNRAGRFLSASAAPADRPASCDVRSCSVSVALGSPPMRRPCTLACRLRPFPVGSIRLSFDLDLRRIGLEAHQHRIQRHRQLRSGRHVQVQGQVGAKNARQMLVAVVDAEESGRSTRAAGVGEGRRAIDVVGVIAAPAPASLERRHHHDHLPAFELGHLLDFGDVAISVLTFSRMSMARC